MLPLHLPKYSQRSFGVVNSMDTDDFIMCLRRFKNRRGDVLELRCDRGSNFVGAERELRESIEKWNGQKIERELL